VDIFFDLNQVKEWFSKNSEKPGTDYRLFSLTLQINWENAPVNFE